LRRLCLAVLLVPALLFGCAKATKEQALFNEHCAACHAPGYDLRAPDPYVMAALPPSVILESLESGKMQVYGAPLTPEERKLLANHLGAKKSASRLSYCASKTPPRVTPVYWSGFSPDLENQRHQSATSAGLEPTALDELELAWAFALPGSGDVRTQPAVLGDLVVVGNTDGRVFALHRETGCVVWTYRGHATVRTPIGVHAEGEGASLYFGDAAAFVTVLDAATGEQRWRRRVHDNYFAMLTGAPVYHAGRIYVPVSSWELVAAIDPKYACCTFKGAVVALDAESGELVWDTPMGELPSLQKKRLLAADQYGPSGAPVWTSPAIDSARGVLYVGTGENYSSPADGWSDAIVALDLETGRPGWVRQTTRDDAFNWACWIPLHPNCPEEDGPDLDFGASPILVERPGGGSLVLAGQKSGVVYALDPDRGGEVVWKRRVGRGGMLGGIHWGMTVAGDRVYVPVSDRPDGHEYRDPARPGLAALDIGTGEVSWQVDVPGDCPRDVPGCHAGLSAPASSTGNRVLTGGLDGHLRIFDAGTGQVVFDRDLREAFPGAPAQVRGGAVDAAGPVVAGGLVLVNSGYPQHNQTPGNALFALRPRR
jgi:polyvinyl alcohol dehydrogenase (cytochrome)